MKKINYLFALIATVFVLGMTSCDPNENSVTPDNPIEDTGFSKFDGAWTNVSTEYVGNTYDAATVCSTLTSITWQRTDFNFRSVDSAVDFIDVCRTFPRDWTVEYDDNTMTFTVTGSFDQKYQIIEFDLDATPKTMTIKLVSNGGENTMPENITYSLER